MTENSYINFFPNEIKSTVIQVGNHRANIPANHFNHALRSNKLTPIPIHKTPINNTIEIGSKTPDKFWL